MNLKHVNCVYVYWHVGEQNVITKMRIMLIHTNYECIKVYDNSSVSSAFNASSEIVCTLNAALKIHAEIITLQYLNITNVCMLNVK